jgi:CheY-like chemotaxis protein
MEIIEKTNSNFCNKTILVVEDDMYNTDYIKEILTNTGCKTIFVENGNDAVEVSLNQNIDLVLVDINLPDISGDQAMRTIKQYKPMLKFIVLTAYADDNNMKKAFSSGCTEFITKPYKSDYLLTMMNKHLS